MTPSERDPVTTSELVAALNEADGLLSLVGYRYETKIGRELAEELKFASGHCRALVKRIESGGLKRSHTLTDEDWSA